MSQTRGRAASPPSSLVTIRAEVYLFYAKPHLRADHVAFPELCPLALRPSDSRVKCAATEELLVSVVQTQAPIKYIGLAS